MKKLLATILALIYLSTSVGATLHLHYCMNKLVAWGFEIGQTNNKSCPYCGMVKTTSDKHCFKQSKGCCKDEQKHIKIEKDQKAAAFQYNLSKQIDGLISYSSTIEGSSPYIISPVLQYPTTHAPPSFEKVPVFIRNCIFRI